MNKVLITGVGSGYGKFMAETFKKMQYNVAGIDKIPANEINSELQRNLLYYWEMDLSNIDDIKERFPSILNEFYPNILINNAGLKFFKEFEKIEISLIEQVINVNFLAPIILTKIWISTNHSKAQLINVLLSSNAAYRGYKKGSLYCSSKGGLRLFAESFNEENAYNNVTTITLCPETFSSSPSISSKYSMSYVFKIMKDAIDIQKSCEIPIISVKSKLRYLYFDFMKYLNWFIK